MDHRFDVSERLIDGAAGGMLEIAFEVYRPDDLIWVRMNGTRLLMDDGCKAPGGRRNHLYHCFDPRLLIPGENAISVERRLLTDNPEVTKLIRLASVTIRVWR
ncbi:MAG: hypothetical protein HY815_25815 [Candidatus Riflebacteria bacterium]|nr:hypothetical protein [Candidatus Riflebacteria bacterium]